MNATMTKLALVSALLIQAAGLQAAFAASSNASNLFQLSEVPGMSSGASVQLAAKCGAGSCGGKEVKKDGAHKCASKKDGSHQCGSKKDGEHKCASKKDGSHQCGSKKDGEHKCAAPADAKKAN